MAVAFGLLDQDDPCAHREVDVLIERLGTGPFLRRYPPGDDGPAGSEGAFLPCASWPSRRSPGSAACPASTPIW